ncbi:MAG: hypothetical protein H6Q73_6 [Firmicutes bacterium]|nr:hypothetical protein [Bacillota bacterium]
MRTSLNKAYMRFRQRPLLWIISVLIIVAYFFCGFFNDKISLFPVGGIKTRTFDIAPNSTSSCPNQIFGWSFDNDVIRLNYDHLAINKKNIEIFYKKKDGSITELAKGYSPGIPEDSNGSFIATTKVLTVDVNNDGHPEKLVVSAKADTIFTRKLAAIVAGVNTHFNDKRIPLEVVLKGNDKLVVYFEQNPLINEEVAVFYDNYSSTLKTDATGAISFDNMNTLRNTVNIMYQHDKTFYLTSYTVEGHRMLSKEHISAIEDLAIILLVSGVIIIIICIFRRYRRRIKNG